MLAEGADAAAMTRSIPIEKVFDDALLAYSQNGERLRPRAGLSPAPAAAGLRRQYERQMVATAEARRRAVSDPRRNFQILHDRCRTEP